MEETPPATVNSSNFKMIILPLAFIVFGLLVAAAFYVVNSEE